MYCTFGDESQEGVVLLWAEKIYNQGTNFIHAPVFQTYLIVPETKFLIDFYWAELHNNMQQNQSNNTVH